MCYIDDLVTLIQIDIFPKTHKALIVNYVHIFLLGDHVTENNDNHFPRMRCMSPCACGYY